MTSPNTPPPGQPDPAALLALGLATQAADGNASSAPPLTPAELAAEFPQLEILELLGRGGMGAVYKARQRDLGRLVALKILRPSLDADPGFAERFTREARALAQLNHPGIVTLYEFGKTSAGRYFILMEFVDGVNLRQLLAAGRLAPREALAIVPPLCDALQYAHDRGLIHRDIKPENLLIDRLGRIKIADFGIARLASERSDERQRVDPGQEGAPSLTSSGEIMGSPHYMAPEQRTHPAAVDHRADLYALGVVLYQMLTGELPSPDQLRPPSTRMQLDVRLDEIVLRALEKDPARRYAAATDFKTQVETVAATPLPESPASATAPDEDDDTSHTGRSWRDLAWASVPLIAVLLVFFNPWGNRAWIYFGAGCTVLALLPDFGLFRRSKPRAPIAPAGAGPSRHHTPSLPLWPASVLMLLMTIFCGFVLFCAKGLPSPVTTHFNLSGQPDGWSERGVALLVLLIAGVGLPLFLVALFGMLRWMPAYLIELPHRDFWLAPQRVALTHARFLRNGLWLAVLVQTFFCTVPPLLLIIHKLEPVHLPPAVAGVIVVVFLTALALWGLRVWLQFRKPLDPPSAQRVADSRLSRLLRPVAPWLLILLAFSAIILPVHTAIKILQVHQENSRRDAAHAAARAAEAAAPRYEFVETIELTLSPGRPGAYDLDRALFVDYKPTPAEPHGLETSPNWHAKNGTDLFADPSSYKPGVLFLGTGLIEVPPAVWNASADTVAGFSQKPSHGLMTFIPAPDFGKPPATRVYRTAQGGLMLIQLLNATDSRDVVLRYKPIRPATPPIKNETPAVSVEDQRALGFDRAGDTMQTIVQRLRHAHGLRLSFENLDFTTADAVTLGARLRELTDKEAKGLLTGAEVDQLRTARRLRDEEKLGPHTLIDLGARYTGQIEGATVPEFFEKLTAGTPYRAHKLGATWLIRPRADSRLAFPVTLKTAGMSVSEAVNAIAKQSPAGRPIAAGMVFAMPSASGVDPTPWLSVQAPELEFARTPASEALCKLGETARPGSVWELAGYQESRMLSVTHAPSDDILPVINTAQAWLAGIDRRSYAAAWRDASAILRAEITGEKFSAALLGVRAPLGKAKVRRLRSAAPLSQLPGGRYLLMQFETEFDSAPAAIETVTFVHEPDGQWRAAGYFINPALALSAPNG